MNKFNRYLQLSDGRQKIARLCQYLCKFIYILFGTQYCFQLQTIFKNILKWHNFLKTSIAIEKFCISPIRQNLYYRLISVINNFFNLLWRFADDISLLKLINLLPTSYSGVIFLYQLIIYTDWFWFLTLSTDIILQFIALSDDLVQLYQLKKLIMMAENEATKNNEGSESKQRENTVQKLKSNCHRQIMNLLLKSMDVFIVLNKLKIIQSYDLVASILGIFTSVGGIVFVWNSV